MNECGDLPLTVYVDDMRARYGRLIMCHMIADTEDELHEMAQSIGVARRWYQRDHYDIALSKRAQALQLGAKSITWRNCALMMAARRRDPSARLLTAEEGLVYVRNKHTNSGAS